MNYTPKQADHNVNVSDQHPLVEAGTLIIGLGVIFAIIAVILILIVEIALYFVPAEKEAAMFDSWLPDDLVTVAFDDSRLDKTEQLLWRLSQHYPESPYEFRVEIDDSPEMNAMAFPGGLIVVTAGLLDQVESENELAFVLGHEMGHFRNRDHIRALGRGVVISLLFVAVSNREGGANLGITISDLTLRGFSRGQEADADEFGLGIVQQEYGHVAESWRFFERMNNVDDELFEFMTYTSTHPSAGDRIEALYATAGENGWPVSGETREISW